MDNGLTHGELVVACRNIGFDLTCGACAAIFYKGTGSYEHDATCTTPSPDAPSLVDDIADFIEAYDDSGDDPMAALAKDVRSRWARSGRNPRA